MRGEESACLCESTSVLAFCFLLFLGRIQSRGDPTTMTSLACGIIKKKERKKKKKNKTRQGSSSNHFQLVPVDEFRPSSMFFFSSSFSLCRESRESNEREIKKNQPLLLLLLLGPLEQLPEPLRCFTFSYASLASPNQRMFLSLRPVIHHQTQLEMCHRTVGLLPCHRDPSGHENGHSKNK